MIVVTMPSLTCVHTFYSSTNINKKDPFRKPSLTYLHNLYNNTNINTKACCQNTNYYICTQSLLQQKHKHKGTYTQRLVHKITSLTCVHTLYTNTNINTKGCFQNAHSYMCTYTLNIKNINTNDCCHNAQSYMCTYLLQQHKHKQKGSFPKTQSYIFT